MMKVPISLTDNTPSLKIVDFSEFIDLIGVTLPPLVDRGKLQTIRIQEILKNSDCKSIAIESHYVDKAFTDEYREFYGSSFTDYKNYCKRLHFFSLSKIDLENKIPEILGQINSISKNADFYHTICRQFSNDSYLGFMVVKPINNTKIGRTILRHPTSDKSAKFRCTKLYKAHLFGLELSVCGLPFQQQDGGMSACASTAMWSSLNQATEFEQFPPPSPAAITKLATKLVMPFGRPIPQENGLTIDQMCQSVQATGLSPYLVGLGGLDVLKRKSIIYSSIKSGFAPILIIKRLWDGASHAVTVSGKVVDKTRKFVKLNNIEISDVGWSLSELYVNDDRISPYHKAVFVEDNGKLLLEFFPNNQKEVWEITHVLIPLHHKIRFALVGLQESAINIANLIVGRGAYKWELETGLNPNCDKVFLETWLSKSDSFQKHLAFGDLGLSVETIEKFNTHLSLPRYIGIIKLEDSSFGTIHVLVDSTNTTTHANYLLVFGHKINPDFGINLVKIISRELDCPYLID